MVRFILVFLGTYLILSLAYNLYLDLSKDSKFFPDFITNLTARQTEILIDNLGYEAQIEPHPDEPSIKLIINGKYVARVIEGCNSLSLIILFTAFILAFRDTAKRTIIYLLAGSVLIYSVNLIRIVILSVGLYHYPWRREILHTVIFPLIIYGMVFLLWMFWIRRFTISKYQNV